MRTLDQLIESRQAEYNAVISRFRIIPSVENIDTIKRGIATHGVRFEAALIEALNDGSFSGWDQDTDGPPSMADLGINVDSTATGSGKFWDFLYTALGAAQATGKTIAEVRADITGEWTPEQLQQQVALEQAKAQQTKLLTWGAVILVVIIIIILIVKR